MARQVLMEWKLDTLVDLMRGHPMSELTSNIPADMKIVRVAVPTYERAGSPLVFVAESVEFDDVPEGAYLPNWTPTYTVRRSELEAVLDLVRPDP